MAPGTTAPDIAQIVAAVRSVVGTDGAVALHEPRFTGNERAYLLECLDSTFVSSVGAFVDRFEAMLAQATGAPYAIACINGTAALQVCLRLAGVEAGDEVMMPALTFVATANSAHFIGAIPHFIDSDPHTLGLGAAALARQLDAVARRQAGAVVNRHTGRRIGAVVPMHMFGHAVAIDEILAVAAAWGLPVVEDATESLGTLYRGRHTGTFGVAAALSFNGNKIITTGGGGAILTADERLARRAKHLTTTAKTPHRWAFQHDEAGYNFRLPNLNAALGCGQLEGLDALVERKRRLAERYRRVFAGVPGLRVFAEPADSRSNYWLNALLLDSGAAGLRDAVLGALNDAGLQARPAWTPMHRLPMYRDNPRGPLDQAEDLERRIVNVPSSPHLAQ
jgi:perosamine synthetase